MLADKLNMSPEEAERWIVNLIRNARLDAKIDSKLVRLPDRTGPNRTVLWLGSDRASGSDGDQSLCSGSRRHGKQRRVAVPAGDREDQEPVVPQPDAGHEHGEESGPQHQERGEPPPCHTGQS